MTPLAAAAIQPEQQNREGPPLLTFLGVGEAGRGCGPAGACPRGCKWAVRAGVVLRLPDHTALQAATAVALPAADEEPLNASHTSAVADGPFELSVYVFRNFTLQLGPQQAVVKALERCEWAAYGFSLVEVSPGGNGPLTLALRCAQPRSGAALTAAVLHLQSEDVVGEATKGRPQTLAASHETRTVRAALEGALRELRAQCPGVMAGRRERSVMRAVPKVAAAVAGGFGVGVRACGCCCAGRVQVIAGSEQQLRCLQASCCGASLRGWRWRHVTCWGLQTCTPCRRLWRRHCTVWQPHSPPLPELPACVACTLELLRFKQAPPCSNGGFNL